MGRAIQVLLDGASSPGVQVSVVLVALVAFFSVLLYRARKAVWSAALKFSFVPWLFLLKFRGKYLTWAARRELKMKRARLLALKERAASALIEWLQTEVHNGGMSVSESYDLQKILARNIAYPALMPQYDPDFVKTQIKARRAQGKHRPVKLPDMNRRGVLKTILHG
jgi:hypothetical protein